MVKAYLSGPIIDTKSRMDDFYKVVEEILKKRGVSVFAPQVIETDASVDVYQRDVHWVRQSDVVVAEVSFASHGVGMEIMLAVQLSKPVLMFRHQHKSPRLSRMISDCVGKALFEYLDLNEVRTILSRVDLNSLLVLKCPMCNSQVVSIIEDENECVLCGHKFMV